MERNKINNNSEKFNISSTLNNDIEKNGIEMGTYLEKYSDLLLKKFEEKLNKKEY
jgi:hypothetical protein